MSKCDVASISTIFPKHSFFFSLMFHIAVDSFWGGRGGGYIFLSEIASRRSRKLFYKLF